MIELDWSHRQLCQAAGMTSSHWSQINCLRVAPKLDTMNKIADAVGLQVMIRQKPNRR